MDSYCCEWQECPVEGFTADSVLYANLISHEDLLDGLCE